VWAHGHDSVVLRVRNHDYPLAPEGAGYFSIDVPGVREGETYSYRIDGNGPFPDPSSRFQPEGPHGPSQIVDPHRFAWTDRHWKGLQLHGQVIYECHVGTFTPEGTWQSAICQLAYLKNLGITAIEVMPVAEFSGAFGWGYDGVDFFAPTRNYGSPDDFRAFVDAAHSHGLGVLLDVVYNHAGPDGNYLPSFSQSYFNQQRPTEWGASVNFDGENNAPVRQFFISNAAYWIKEFHLDGLRLDATHSIHDSSRPHILTEIARAVRRAAEPRGALIVSENESQDASLVKSEAHGGCGLDATWNEDFHHSALVAATGARDAFFSDYLGSSQELLSSFKYGFLFQGQWYPWQKKRRGTSTLDVNPAALVSFIQNHDQVANSARGQRIHELTTFGRFKAITAVCLLAPSTPMLFQGQEFAASAPFLYFADHEPKQAELVRKGRIEFLMQWRNLATKEINFDDPGSRRTFEKCKLDLSECEKHAQVLALHRDLIALRSGDPLFSRQTRQLDGAVLSLESFIVRLFSDDFQQDRLLVINLGAQLYLNPPSEPLLGPPHNSQWDILWSTEDPKYGGSGTPALDSEQSWIIPSHAAVVLVPGKKKEESPAHG
jgi:maltooligosyltrehalose trehalohydrolase